MVELLGSVVKNSHDVGIIVLIVIVEWIEEHTQTVPAIRRTKDVSIIVSLSSCKPESLQTSHEHYNGDQSKVQKQLTKPSAPILPRPDTRNTISISHHSKFVRAFVQMAPFWLRNEGATRTLSELAIASVNVWRT